LEALEDVVRYLNGIREERKAILTVTEGWTLFTPDRGLEKVGKDPITGKDKPPPGLDPVGVGPDGKLTTKDPRNLNSLTNAQCIADRQRLANIDDEQFLHDLINEANRSNATFYPIDPRGLVAFKTAICGDDRAVRSEPVPLAEDARLRRAHESAIRSMADGTDGIVVMDSNDLDKGLKRISDDLFVLLPARLLLDELEDGWRVSFAQGPREAAGHRPARAARLSGRKRGGRRAGA
jgi:hypothetical protein